MEPEPNVSSPNLIGTLTKEFFEKNGLVNLSFSITLLIKSLMALDPMSIAASLYIVNLYYFILIIFIYSIL